MLACLLAIGRDPTYGLIAYVAAFYVEPASRWWGQGWMQEVRWVFVAAGVTALSLLLHKRSASGSAASRSGAAWGTLLFLIWVIIQSAWVLDSSLHFDFLVMWIKFAVVFLMICLCIDSEAKLRKFLWAHVIGCFYLGWTAYAYYRGGRFEGFGDSQFGEANAGALQLVTGLVVVGALFLAEKWPARAMLIVIAAFIANGIVTTVSRSGFLAALMAGLAFNLFVPVQHRRKTRVLSAIAAVLFLSLTTQHYWDRMQTIKHVGTEVEGVDTGGGRREIIAAQWQMFLDHPFGCGHACTAVLSPQYMDPRLLSIGGMRASHNTVMTMLVDHGIPGVIFYFAMLYWVGRSTLLLAKRLRGGEGFYSALLPGLAAVFTAITVGDVFVQYPKLEVRIWFIGLLAVMLQLTSVAQSAPARLTRPARSLRKSLRSTEM